MFTLGAMAILSASVSLAHASEKHSSLVLKPYIGAGMGMTWINSNDDNLRPLMKGQYPNSHIIAGVNIGEYFGIEVGIDTQKRKNREHMYPAGVPIPPTGSIVNPRVFKNVLVTEKLNIRSFDFGINGYLPLDNLHPMLKDTQIFTGAGLSYTVFSGNLTAKNVIMDDGTIFHPNIVTPFKDTGIIPYARLGIIHNIATNVSFRILGEWKQFNKLHIISRGNTEQFKLGLKNVFSAKIGISYSF